MGCKKWEGATYAGGRRPSCWNRVRTARDRSDKTSTGLLFVTSEVIHGSPRPGC